MADPAPFEWVNRDGGGPVLLLCEHASNWMPEDYGGLGLSQSDRERHIAWDIGAAAVARRIAERTGAPLILSGASRLLIDLNRPLTSRSSIPEQSEATAVPGNIGIAEAEREARAERWFHPFQREVQGWLDRAKARGERPAVVGIHSFTPVFLGVRRPWHVGILYRKSAAYAGRLIEGLGGAEAMIAGNQPYQIDDDSDYTVPVHGEARGLESVLVELRQDLVAGPRGQAEWADRLTPLLMRG